MLISGMVSVSHNLNRQQTNLSLFEFGKSYKKAGTGYQEDELLTLFMTGKKNEESWLLDNKVDKSFYEVKKAVYSILQRIGIQNFQVTELDENPRFTYGIRIHKGPIGIAEFGEVKKTLCQKMGIKTTVYFAEISFDSILKNIGKEKMHVKEISKYPTVRRDLAIVVDKQIKFAEIETIAKQADKKLLKQISLFDVYENEQQLGANKKSYAVSFVFENTEKTLNDIEIDSIMAKLTTQLSEKTGAIIRK